MKIKLNEKIAHVCCYVLLAIAAVPVIDYFCPWYITALPLIGIFLFIAMRPKVLLKTVLYMALAVAFLLIQYFVVYENVAMTDIVINGAIAASPGIVAIYLYEFEETDFKKRFLQVTSIALFITAITTIIGLSIYPMASRELATGSALYDTERYTLINIGGYNYIYALVVFLPIQCWLIKKAHSWGRALNILILIAYLVAIVMSQYTIAIIVAVLMLLIVLFVASRHKVIIVGAAVMFILLLYLSGETINEGLSNLFAWLSKNSSLDYVSDRFLQVSQVFDGESVHTATSTARLDYYYQCLENFFKSPWIGNNFAGFSAKYVSGHSTILDIMAGLGLLGLSVAFLNFFFMFRIGINPSGRKLSRTVVVCWLGMIIVSILNPSMVMLIFIMLFPCCSCIEDIESEEADETASEATPGESAPNGPMTGETMAEERTVAHTESIL